MLTSRSVARGLLFLSVSAVLLSSVHARPHVDVAFPNPTPAPVPGVVARQVFGFPPKTTTDTNAQTGTDAPANGITTTDKDPAKPTTDTTTDPNTTTTTDPGKPTDTDTTTTTANPNTDTTTTTTGGGADTTTTSNGNTGDQTTGQPDKQTTPPATPTVTDSISTKENGDVTTIQVTIHPTQTDSASESAGADQNKGGDSKPSSPGISKSTIIGLSVAGGVALIGIVTFVVWKFTRKRFTDDDFDNEAIKWPELNAHGEEPSHALPTNRTGGAGFETSSQVNLTRPDSRAGSVAPSAGGSSVDLYSARDPYAVPPLPHLNPNVTQPYRDDPSTAYYDNDPYAPVPPTEAIPMTQINRTRSPAPQMAYGYADGRVSPGPQQALGLDPRARSPGPGALYGGHMSPAPPQAGRMSPGPQMAYGPGPGY